jgi:hypothetical protein
MEITIPGVAAAYGPLVQPSVALKPVAPAVDPLAVGVAGWSDHGQLNDPTPVELRSGAEPPEGMLRISKTGEEELFIWPVHRREWLALGWRVVGAADGGPTPLVLAPLVLAPLVSVPLVSGPLVLAPLVPEVDQPAELSAQVTGQVALPEATAAVLPEVVTPAVVLPDIEVMTKAQIIDFCGVNYGVQLDGSATKAVLVEQALVLAGNSEQLDSPGAVTPGVPSDLLV